MRRYRGSSLKIDWHDDELLDEVGNIIEVVTSKAADVALNTAQALVPVGDGTLRSEIDIYKSKFRHGGYVVVAQGPGNYSKYYASFVELGHHSSLWKKGYKKGDPTVYVPPKPFMRPALKKVRRIFRKAMKEALGDSGV